MLRNSIDYHGGRAPRRPAVIAQDGYAALFTAAKHWGYKFTSPEYHQNASATKLHYTPDTRPGALG